MLTQKLYKSGNSVAVTIPKEFLQELNLKEGAQVVVKKRGKDLIVSSRPTSIKTDVNQEFAKMVDEFINEHRDVLQELSKR